MVFTIAEDENVTFLVISNMKLSGKRTGYGLRSVESFMTP